MSLMKMLSIYFQKSFVIQKCQVAPLAKVLLQAKHLGKMIKYICPSEFLCQAINKPSLEQFEVALCELATCGAIVRQVSQSQEKPKLLLLASLLLVYHWTLNFVDWSCMVSFLAFHVKQSL